MGFIPLDEEDFAVERPVTNEFAQVIKDDLDYLYLTASRVEGRGFQNFSFETPEIPEGQTELEVTGSELLGWTITGTGCTVKLILDDEDTPHGTQHLEIDKTSGTGTCSIESDFIDIVENNVKFIGFYIKSHIAATYPDFFVNYKYYDSKTGSATTVEVFRKVSGQDCWTDWKMFFIGLKDKPSESTAFLKIEFGIKNSDAITGKIYFDYFRVNANEIDAYHDYNFEFTIPTTGNNYTSGTSYVWTQPNCITYEETLYPIQFIHIPLEFSFLATVTNGGGEDDQTAIMFALKNPIDNPTYNVFSNAFESGWGSTSTQNIQFPYTPDTEFIFRNIKETIAMLNVSHWVGGSGAKLDSASVINVIGFPQEVIIPVYSDDDSVWEKSFDILNPNFDAIETNGDPKRWDITDIGSGFATVDQTYKIKGKNSCRIAVGGTSGNGAIVESELIPIIPAIDKITASFTYTNDLSGNKFKCYVEYYSDESTHMEGLDEDVLPETSSPSTLTDISHTLHVVPTTPTKARYAKLCFKGWRDDATSSNIYFGNIGWRPASSGTSPDEKVKATGIVGETAGYLTDKIQASLEIDSTTPTNPKMQLTNDIITPTIDDYLKVYGFDSIGTRGFLNLSNIISSYSGQATIPNGEFDLHDGADNPLFWSSVGTGTMKVDKTGALTGINSLKLDFSDTGQNILAKSALIPVTDVYTQNWFSFVFTHVSSVNIAFDIRVSFYAADGIIQVGTTQTLYSHSTLQATPLKLWIGTGTQEGAKYCRIEIYVASGLIGHILFDSFEWKPAIPMFDISISIATQLITTGTAGQWYNVGTAITKDISVIGMPCSISGEIEYGNSSVGREIWFAFLVNGNRTPEISKADIATTTRYPTTYFFFIETFTQISNIFQLQVYTVSGLGSLYAGKPYSNTILRV